MRHYKLIKPWRYLRGMPAENFGRGSIVQASFREDLPDFIHFTGRRAKLLGCCIYNFAVDMEFEPAKRKGKKWVTCKGPDLLKRHENKKLGI